MRAWLASATLLLGLLAPPEGRAASLQVAPVTVDLSSPAQAAAISLTNRGARPINAQIRVFRWTQSGGEDRLDPTTDVVASPPAAALQPGATYTIRVARLKPPVTSGEESYRLFVDELPDVNLRRPATEIALVFRYSLPVFFADRSAGANLRWTVRKSGAGLVVEASNAGDRHAKVANLVVGGVRIGPGLNGYVLPGSLKRWSVSSGAQLLKPGAPVKITGFGDDYAIDETVALGGG